MEESSKTLCRRDGPQTSEVAAEQAITSEKVRFQRRRLLAALRENPGLTRGELATIAGVPQHDATKRMSDLRNQGHAANGPARICSVCKTQQMTWLPAVCHEPVAPATVQTSLF